MYDFSLDIFIYLLLVVSQIVKNIFCMKKKEKKHFFIYYMISGILQKQEMYII